jgi:hypothetical protein
MKEKVYEGFIFSSSMDKKGKITKSQELGCPPTFKKIGWMVFRPFFRLYLKLYLLEL